MAAGQADALGLCGIRASVIASCSRSWDEGAWGWFIALEQLGLERIVALKILRDAVSCLGA